MKKYFTLFLFLFWNLNSPAQQEDRFFVPGVALGINGCQIHGDDQSGYRKAGIFGGLDVRFEIMSRNLFQLGLFYSEKGAQKNQNPEKGDYTFYQIHLRYIEMPLTYFRILNEKKYFISAGIYAAYLVNYNEYNEFGNWTGAYPFNKFEFGLNAGLGKYLTERIIFECRFGNSVLPIRNYGIRGTGIYYPNPLARIFNKGLYNNILTLGLYYRFKPDKNNKEA